MKVTKFETWWVRRDRCLFDEKRQGGSIVLWDVVVLKLTCDDETEGIATAMAARSGQITEGCPQETVVPLVLGRDPHDCEAVFYDFWNLDCHEAFYPMFLPEPVDVVLRDMYAKKAGLSLYKYIDGYRESLPIYASGLFYDDPRVCIDEALHYRPMGINRYKVHPSGPVEKDMEIHRKPREAVGDDMGLMSDSVGEYMLDEVIRVGRQLEKLNYIWFEEPFRDFKLHEYQKLCQTLDISIAATEITRGAHWDVAQFIAQDAANIVRTDVSWKYGITGTLKIVHIVDVFSLNCEIHIMTMNYMDPVNLHVFCAIRNCKYLEYSVPEDSFRFPMKGDLSIRDGRIYVPKEPGIGAESDWDLIKDNCVAHKAKILDQDFIE